MLDTRSKFGEMERRPIIKIDNETIIAGTMF